MSPHWILKVNPRASDLLNLGQRRTQDLSSTRTSLSFQPHLLLLTVHRLQLLLGRPKKPAVYIQASESRLIIPRVRMHLVKANAVHSSRTTEREISGTRNLQFCSSADWILYLDLQQSHRLCRPRRDRTRKGRRE